jgi:hypothetical protein
MLLGVSTILVAILFLLATPARAQWSAPSPSPVDPFTQVARVPDNSAAAANGPVFPPLPGPVVSGPIPAAPGIYLPGPAPGPPMIGPPPYGAPGGQLQDSMPFQPAVSATRPDVSPAGGSPVESQLLLPAGTSSAYRLLDHLEVDGVARGYYENDQRIAWSGMEDNFGAEGIIAPRLRQRCDDFEFIVDSEFYINEPFGGNQLLTDPERRSYAANFQVPPFEISQLALVTNYGDWTFKIGKFVTPFGRFYFPLYTNSRMDAPFIRTDVIGWRETGLLAHYRSGCFIADVALTDGSQDLGTNSEKSLVARAGLESELWAVGCSVKKGGGNGSEIEKEFDNQLGMDMMVRQGPFQLSSECVYDQYGFGRPGFDPMDITWVKSIYYRDVSSGQQGVPCTGIGYYVNAGYAEGPWNASLNYGDYFPLFTGTAPDQRVQRRGLLKAAYQIAQPLQFYSILILENGGYIAQENQRRRGVAVVEGFQFTF